MVNKTSKSRTSLNKWIEDLDKYPKCSLALKEACGRCTVLTDGRMSLFLNED